MFFYQILIAHRLPVSFLVYKSEQSVSLGQVVEVTVRNKLYLAVVVSQLEDTAALGYDVSKVKQISRSLPFRYTDKYLQFIKTFSYNSFNDICDIAISCLQFHKFLPKNNLKIFQKKQAQ
jgi:hypothetical protein